MTREEILNELGFGNYGKNCWHFDKGTLLLTIFPPIDLTTGPQLAQWLYLRGKEDGERQLRRAIKDLLEV